MTESSEIPKDAERPRNLSGELKFLLKHSSIYGVGTVLNKGVAFLMLPLYTSHLTPTDYGVMELIDTTTGLIGVVVGLGVLASISRFYYERQTDEARNKLISTAYILTATSAAAIVIVANLFAPLLARTILDSETYTWYFRISFASLLVGVLSDVGQGYLRMQFKSVLFISLSTFSLILGVCLNIYFVAYLHLGVLSILYTSLILRLVIGVPLTARILSQTGLRFSTSDAKALLRYSMPLLPATVGMTLVNYSDRYFIKGLTSIADAGIYSLAQKLGGVLHFIITGPFISTFQPRRFQLAQERKDVPTVLATVFDAFFILLLILSLGLSIFTPEIMRIMTTESFYRAGLFVPPVVLYHFIFAMKYHVDWGIMHSGKTEQYMMANVLTAIIQIVGAFFFIRAFGLWGAVYALLVSTTFNIVFLHVLSSRSYPVPFNFARMAKLVGLATVIYLISGLIDTSHLLTDVFFKTLLLLSFVALLPLSRLVTPNEASQIMILVRSGGRPLPSDREAEALR